MGLRLYGLPEPSQQIAMPSPTPESEKQQPQYPQYEERQQQQQQQQQTAQQQQSWTRTTTPPRASQFFTAAVPAPAPVSPLASTLSTALGRYRNGGNRATGAGVNTGAGITRPKTEAELEADRLYEEAMEDEYAKRDGGS